MKVALVYDRVNKWGGAERVLLALHRIFPDAPLYTSIRDIKNSVWANSFKVHTSFLNNNIWSSRNDVLAPLMPIAFESFDFGEYDLVISVTSEAAKGIITKPHTKHLCYCLTPTRYLWSGYKDYFDSSIMRFLATPAVSYLRSWDKVAANRPDKLVAISTEVKERIRQYYGLESEIVFPPIMIDNVNVAKSSEKYFLLVSRFSRYNQYKKVDLVIDAFNKTGQNLKVVGGGPLLGRFKNKAAQNIEFLGEIDDSELAFYYSNSQALIFPGLEDFGLVMAESLFFGRPVIAFSQGGARDIIKEGVTGEFFKEQSVDSMLSTLEKFKASSYNKAVIEESAERFSFENFEAGLKKQIDSL